MVSLAAHHSWPGFEAFFVSAGGGPCYLIQVERTELARRLSAGDRLDQIITERRDQ